MRIICKELKTIDIPKELEYQLLTDNQKVKPLIEEFREFPLLYVDSEEHLIFSAAVWKLVAKKSRKCEIIQLKVDFRRGLILGWKLQKALLGANIGQQLLFLHRMINFFSEKELLQFGFSFTPNETLRKKLPRLLSDNFFPAILNGHLALKTALRIIDYDSFDFQPLIKLFMQFKFSENEQRILVEMFSELAFKSGKSISELLANFSPQALRDFPTLRHELQNRLYPTFSADFQRWQSELKKFNFPSEVHLEASPFFEKDEYKLSMKMYSRKQFEALLKELVSFFGRS